jgi:hypothetical protein
VAQAYCDRFLPQYYFHKAILLSDARGCLSAFRREWCRSVLNGFTTKKIGCPFKKTTPDPNQEIPNPPDLLNLETCLARFNN